MTENLKSVGDDLRGRLADCDDRELRLTSERDGLAFAAVVERQAKAVKRVAEINTELATIANETATLKAALAEATRRELAAADAEAAKRKRNDAEQAEPILVEAEALAAQLDEAMRTMKEAAVAFEGKMEQVRRLTGAGPQHAAVRALLSRALRAGLQGLPMHHDLVPPGERHSVNELATSWAQQIRNRIAVVLETAKAA